MSEKDTSGIRAFYRLLAMVLTVVFLIAFFIGSNIRIKINAEEGTDVENAAASYLMDNTEYVNENIFTRSTTYVKTRLMNDQTFNMLYDRASVAIADGEYADALEYIKDCIVAYEGNEQNIEQDLWIKKACLEAMLKQYEPAIESFDNLTYQNRTRQDIAQIIISIYIELNKIDDAKEYFIEYLENSPDDKVMNGMYAELLYLEGDFQGAIKIYDYLIENFEDSQDVFYMMRGMCCVQADMYTDAIDDFTSAIDSGYEDTAVCYDQIARCHYMLGDNENTLIYADKTIEAKKEGINLGEVYNLKGLAYFQMQDYENAIENFSQCLDGSNDIVGVYYYRGICYMVQGEYNEAVADFDYSINDEYETAICYYNKGLCNLQLNNIAEAKSDFLNAKENTEDESIIELADEFLDMLN